MCLDCDFFQTNTLQTKILRVNILYISLRSYELQFRLYYAVTVVKHTEHILYPSRGSPYYDVIFQSRPQDINYGYSFFQVFV